MGFNNHDTVLTHPMHTYQTMDRSRGSIARTLEKYIEEAAQPFIDGLENSRIGDRVWEVRMLRVRPRNMEIRG